MSFEERERVVSNRDTEVGGAPVVDPGYTTGERARVRERSVAYRPSSFELLRRVLSLIFGIIIGLIVLRIIFLLLNAREANPLVSGILGLSQVFVAPFEGILRTDALSARGSVLDVAAIVAIVGWSIVYLLVLAVLNIFRREPTV